MSGVKEGIYLETREINLGTGHTARSTKVRNFYAVRRGEGGRIEVLLLDEKLRPTGVREEVEPGELASRMVHVPKLDPLFSKLKPLLDKLPAPAPPPRARSSPKPKEERTERSLAWWELTQKGADHLLKK